MNNEDNSLDRFETFLNNYLKELKKGRNRTLTENTMYEQTRYLLMVLIHFKEEKDFYEYIESDYYSPHNINKVKVIRG